MGLDACSGKDRFNGEPSQVQLFFSTVEASLMAAGVDVSLIANTSTSSPPPRMTRRSQAPQPSRARRQQAGRATSAATRRRATTTNDDDDDDDDDNEDLTPWVQPTAATGGGGTLDQQTDSAVFVFLTKQLQGVPLRLAVHDNPRRSGKVAYQRLKQRYFQTGQDYIHQLQSSLRNIRWTPEDNVDSFTSRIIEIDSSLRENGIDTPFDEVLTIIRNSLPDHLELGFRFIELRKPKTLAETTRLLLQEEKRTKSATTTTAADNVLATIPTPHQPFPSHEPRELLHQATTAPTAKQKICPCNTRHTIMTCSFCGIRGHCAQACFKLQNAKSTGLIDVQRVLQELRQQGKRHPKHSSGFNSKRSARAHTAAVTIDGGVFAVTTTNINNNSTSRDTSIMWIVDTGATAHVTPHQHLLSNYRPTTRNQSVLTADGTRATVQGTGTALLTVHSASGVTHTLALHNVLHVERISFNLIGLQALLAQQPDASIHITQRNSSIRFATWTLPLVTNQTGHLIVQELLQLQQQRDDVLATLATTTADSGNNHELTHARLGHMAVLDAIAARARNKVPCHSCGVMKSTRARISKKSRPRTAAPLKLLYADIVGPFPASARKFRYAVSFTDDATRFTWTFLMSTKDQVSTALVHLRRHPLVRGRITDSMLQTDSDAVFRSAEFRDKCTTFGLAQRFSPPYSQAKNGVAERTFRSLLDTTRTLLAHANLDDSWWDLAIKHATTIHNVSPTKKLQGRTPHLELTGEHFDAGRLRVFGAQAFVHIETRPKLGPRARTGVYVGHCFESDAHLVWLPDTSRLVTTIHARFNELIKTSPSSEPDTDDLTPTVSEENAILPSNELTAAPPSDELSDDDLTPTVSEENALHIQHDSCAAAAGEYTVGSSSSPSTTQESAEPDEHILTTPTTTAQAIQTANGIPTTTATATPATTTATDGGDDDTPDLKAALASAERDEWLKAIAEEATALETSNVYNIVKKANLPANAKVLQTKIVLRRKRDQNGEVKRLKARIVVKGFNQRHGIDYNETFAPTASKTAVRALFALATREGMYLCQMDIVTAFLYADLDADHIYAAPPAIEGLFQRDEVLHLQKALYGLKQAPRLWGKTLHNFMLSQHFVATQTDACLFTKNTGNGRIWLAVYVDDIVVASDQLDALNNFKSELSKTFNVKDLGTPSFCLGVNIEYNREERRIRLGQKQYIVSLLQRFNMNNAKEASTPLPSGFKDRPTTKGAELPDVPFRNLVGSLLHLATTTRPDIATACSCLTRRMSCYSLYDWKVAKHVLRYLKGTANLCLQYDNSGNMTELVGYTDASFEADYETGRSRTGFVLCIANGPVSWNSRLQRHVSTSTAEAEYIALSDAMKEIIFLRQLQQELTTGGCLGTAPATLPPTTVFSDNQPAIAVANLASSRMRHIRLLYHFTRECIMDQAAQLQYIASEQNPADLLTKALSKKATQQHVARLMQQTPLSTDNQ